MRVQDGRAIRAAVVAGTLCVSVWGALPAEAQAPTRRPPRFAAGVDQIRVSVSVIDARDRYVDGLAETDFTVFEDGAPQKLSFFTRDPQPLSVALLVDGSGSMQPNLAEAQAAGERFIRTLAPGDLAQVVQFSDRMQVLQDFTAEQAPLLAAIRGTRATGSTALYTALYVTLKQLASHGTSEVPRRRAIVLLSDGEDTASLATDEQVLEQARVSDVGVYAIALRPATPRERQRLSYLEATHFLTSLARETGAQVLVPGSASALDAAYARVAEELRTQYTLGYVSTNPRRDGTWRRIVVRMPGRADLQLRHKLGYRAARP
jgi:Ca-activated chloride channel homolog